MLTVENNTLTLTSGTAHILWELKAISLAMEKDYQQYTNTCGAASGKMVVNYLAAYWKAGMLQNGVAPKVDDDAFIEQFKAETGETSTTTIERITKTVNRYYNLFYYDNYEIFECTRKHPVYGQPGGRKCYKDYFRLDDSGRVYTNSIELGILPEEADFWENEDMWNSARITFKDSQKIILTMHYELPYGQVEGDVTVEYRKTPNGWRVYNGDIVSDGWGEPPETGDNTPILLTLTALSVFGLVALAVTVKRKEKLT